MADQLAVFLQGSEGVFLDAGSRLGDLVGDAQTVLRATGGAFAQWSDEGQANPAERLVQAMDQMTAWLEQSRTAEQDDARLLDQILSDAHFIGTRREDFRRISDELRILAVATRVESSREGVSASGFDAVVEDVRNLGATLTSTMGTLLSEAEALSVNTSDLRARMEQQASNRATLSSGALAEVAGSLTSLRDLARSSGTVASNGLAISDHLEQETRAILRSLQTHDIVRQRIEHVIQGLREAGEEIGRGRGASGRGSDLDAEPDGFGRDLDEDGEPEVTARELADLCRVFKVQLDSSKSEFTAALVSLGDGLRTVSQGIGSLVQQTAVISGGNGGTALLDQVSRGSAQAAENFRRYSSLGQEATEKVIGIVHNAEMIANHVRGIKEAGLMVQLVAVNAHIMTFQLGDTGRALKVLASEVRRLADDVQRHIAAVTETLQSTSERARSLQSELADRALRQDTEVGMISGDVGALVQGLRDFHGELQTRMGSLANGSRTLHEGVESILRGISFQMSAAAALDPVGEEIASLHREMVGQAAREPRAAARGRLDSLASRYTMESERLVHHAALGRAPSAGGNVAASDGNNPGTEGPQKAAGEFGDNMEFF